MLTEHQKNLQKIRQQRHRLKHRDRLRIRDKLYKRELRKKIPEHFREYDKKYRQNNPEKFKKYYLKRKDKMKIWARNRLLAKYGLNQEIFNQKLILQEGKCAICKLKFGSRIEIDHCHISGKTRDLLCEQCNLALGYIEKQLQANINILEEFAKYLKIHSN